MSGGVDSSVAACLLKEQGYECIGVFLRVGVEAPVDETCSLDAQVDEQPKRRLKHGCCSATDALDARTIANRLGIPFYALNFKADFDRIIDYFVDEYGQARTPNPCVRCNIDVKFGRLLRYADAMDAPLIATGHYARIVRDDSGAARLARGANHAKDQSYVLFGIRRPDLQRCCFPIGEYADKAEVRSIAASLGLQVHDKPDSQEICFVPNGDYRQLVRERRPEAFQPGEMQDADGNVVGQHEGVAAYTIGQRRGLALAMGYPIYVTNIDPQSNRVTVGDQEALLSRELQADDVNWHVDPPNAPLRCRIKIRHMHTPTPGAIHLRSDGDVVARFDDPQTAVTPGQAAVFYDDAERVIAGGWIRSRSGDK